MDETRQQILVALKELKTNWEKVVDIYYPNCSRVGFNEYRLFLGHVIRAPWERYVKCWNEQDTDCYSLSSNNDLDTLVGWLSKHVGRERFLEVEVNHDDYGYEEVIVCVKDTTREPDDIYLERLERYVEKINKPVKTKEQVIAELEAQLKKLKGE